MPSPTPSTTRWWCFYLIEIGYVALALKSAEKPADAITDRSSARSKAWCSVLGVMHLFNVWLFSRFRRQGRRRHEPPPIPPSERLAPAR